MNKHSLNEREQAQMAAEMRARLTDIESCDFDTFPHELGKIEAMLTVWLVRMGEHKND